MFLNKLRNLNSIATKSSLIKMTSDFARNYNLQQTKKEKHFFFLTYLIIKFLISKRYQKPLQRPIRGV